VTLRIAWYGKTPDTTWLARMDLDGTNYRELTPAFRNPVLTDTVAWSRDGKSLFLRWT